MSITFEALMQQILCELANITDATTLQQWHKQNLGKHGLISEYNKKIKDISLAEKAAYGQKIQAHKIILEEEYAKKLTQMQISAAEPLYDAFKPAIDIGSIHPLTFTKHSVIDMFLEQGYAHIEGPDIDTTHHNFDFLNTPIFHPSRHATDTFYLENSKNLLLRTHTTALQQKALQAYIMPARKKGITQKIKHRTAC